MLKDTVPIESMRRALVIKLRHHGDVLLSAPVLSALKAQAPEIQIDALVYDDTAAMLEAHPALSVLHTVGRRWRNLGLLGRLRAEWRLFFALRARQYDLLVHLTEAPRGAWLARTLGARWSVAPQVPGRGRFWRRSFTHYFSVLRNGRRHQVELNLDALRRIGLQPTLAQRRVHIVAGDAAEHEVAQRLQHVGLTAKSFVHLHPASRWQFKCWSAEKNAHLIDQLVARGERVLITAAPDAAEQAFVETILARTKAPVINWAGTLSIKQLVALVAQAKVSVCVDSMPLHVASATSTPVVALFGPSGDQEWGPWMVPHAVVTSDHTCRPCGQDGCGGGKVSDCLEQLDVARVMRAVSQLIDTP